MGTGFIPFDWSKITRKLWHITLVEMGLTCSRLLPSHCLPMLWWTEPSSPVRLLQGRDLKGNSHNQSFDHWSANVHYDNSSSGKSMKTKGLTSINWSILHQATWSFCGKQKTRRTLLAKYGVMVTGKIIQAHSLGQNNANHANGRLDQFLIRPESTLSKETVTHSFPLIQRILGLWSLY